MVRVLKRAVERSESCGCRFEQIFALNHASEVLRIVYVVSKGDATER